MPRVRPRRVLPATVLLAALACFGGARPAHAHFRDFPFTRDWALPFKGEKEIESRSAFLKDGNVFAQELEFEYGLTEHFALEPGVQFVREPDGNFHYDAFDVEARFNWGKFHTGRFLPALNLQYEQPDGVAGKVEAKLIGTMYGKDGSTLSVNLNFGRSTGSNGTIESEYSVGYVRPVPSKGKGTRFKAGLELIHSLRTGDVHLGPVLIYRASRELNFVTHYVFPVHSGNADVGDPDAPGGQVFRFIAEYEFR
jgi:hypothetical protein